ncbi:MAG: endonuclease III domain-containing protein [Gammaproteobacteria bacterium]
MSSLTFYQVYKILLRSYGPQRWWPADSPFEVMVGAVLTQNTSWLNVERAIANLKQDKALTAKAIAGMRHARLANLLKPAGYFNIKATRLQNFCRWYTTQGGLRRLQRYETDALRQLLLSVNGVGPETADDMLLYAFERPVFVIDAYTRRLFSRLTHIAGDESYEALRQQFQNSLSRVKQQVKIFNEYHALIVQHAKQACRSKPQCHDCCLRRHCPGV